ncbi:MAG: carboxyl-terminal protease [Verrucomicrobia bacterium]|nr:carboxyl-terminal protease [Verrucomicrobiota bacterium]
MNSVEGAEDGGIDEPIYKAKQMHTVTRMLKRILTLAAGVALGLGLSVAAVRVAMAWGFFPKPELDRSTSYVREVLQLVNENYVDAKAAGYDKLAKSAIHGLVESLDPHSEFLESKDYSLLEEELSGDFSGIGVQVEMRKGRVVVIAPIAGSPGERAGIQRGDEITKVDGRALEKGLDMDAVIDRLRGKPRTEVAVGFYRPSTSKSFELKLKREVIKQQSVRLSRVLPAHTGYIQITEFSDHTGEEFVNALNGLLKEGIDSLIIDLRGNPGGLLDAAVEVAEPFFNKNEIIVYTQGRKPEDREDYRAAADDEPLKLPIVVLINAGSASAAEVVTGALKDTGRAVIVGERSFGKGSVQSIFKLKNGEGLRLTTARYFTPGGVSIHEKGIAPQVEVVMTPDEDSKLRLQRLRADVTDPADFKERFGFTPIEDRQLQVAIDVLKGINLIDAGRPESVTR